MTEPDAPPGRRLLIGVGNRDRGDDAAGPIVCDLVSESRPPGLTIEVLEGSVVDLPLRWEPDDRVTIVDASAPAGHPGRVTTIDALADGLADPGAVSTHSIDVAAAVELARALGRLPSRLHILAIEGASFEFGAAPTDEVLRGIARVVARVRREVTLVS